MSEAAQPALADFKAQPFELLREMERRSRAALAGSRLGSEATDEWVGIGYQLGGERFLIARNEIREVMMMPDALTRVPGAKDWVAGLANLRGQILTVVDLRSFLAAGSSRSSRTARVLVVESQDMPVGLIVDEVFGFRRFSDNEFCEQLPDTALRCERFLTGAYERGQDVWPVFSLSMLLDTPEFQKAAA